MLTIQEHTLSRVQALRGADDPFISIPPYESTPDALLEFFNNSTQPYTINRDGKTLYATATSSAGIITHKMTMTGNPGDLDQIQADHP